MVEWGFALRIVIVGLSVVFSVLITLAIIMRLMGVLYLKRDKMKPLLTRVGIRRPEAPVEPEEEEVVAPTSEEIAAISAAISAYLEKPRADLEEPRVEGPRKPMGHVQVSRWVLADRKELMNASTRRKVPRWGSSANSNWTLVAREELMRR